MHVVLTLILLVQVVPDERQLTPRSRITSYFYSAWISSIEPRRALGARQAHRLGAARRGRRGGRRPAREALGLTRRTECGVADDVLAQRVTDGFL